MSDRRTLREWDASAWRWIGDREFSARGFLIVVVLIVLVVVAILLINHFSVVPKPHQ